MDKVLVLAHTEPDGQLAKPVFEVLGAVQALGAKFTLGIIGQDTKEAAKNLANAGADKILSVSGVEFASARYSSDSAAVEALVKAVGPEVVVASATSRFSRVLAGVGQRLNGRSDSHVTKLEQNSGVLTVTRWVYRQRIEVQVQRTHKPWFILVEPASQEYKKLEPGNATAENISVSLPALKTKVTAIKSVSTGEQTIRPDAALLFVAGAGWTKKQADGQTHIKEATEHILNFIRKSKASLGSSKSLVDIQGEGGETLSFLTHMHQVGQTGSIPRHPKGLSTCCHGEEPHAVGWRFINERRAINLDANCGWARGKADVLYVADAFEVMKKVNELLK